MSPFIVFPDDALLVALPPRPVPKTISAQPKFLSSLNIAASSSSKRPAKPKKQNKPAPSTRGNVFGTLSPSTDPLLSPTSVIKTVAVFGADNEKENVDPVTGLAPAMGDANKKSKKGAALPRTTKTEGRVLGENGPQKALSSKPKTFQPSKASVTSFASQPLTSMPRSTVFGFAALGRLDQVASFAVEVSSTNALSKSPMKSQSTGATTMAYNMLPRYEAEPLEATVTGRIILRRMAEAEEDRLARELTEVVLGDISGGYQVETLPGSPVTDFSDPIEPEALALALLAAMGIDGHVNAECSEAYLLPTVLKNRTHLGGIEQESTRSDNISDLELVRECPLLPSSRSSQEAETRPWLETEIPLTADIGLALIPLNTPETQ